MKSILPAIAIATGGLLGLASFGAHAADGTITITGTVTNTTCSINGAAAGTPADLTVTLTRVSTARSLTARCNGRHVEPDRSAIELDGMHGWRDQGDCQFRKRPDGRSDDTAI